MKNFLTGLICAVLLVGCAAPRAPLLTPSGNPEVTIQGASKKQVLDKIVAGTVSQGMQIKSVNDYGAVMGKRLTDTSSSLIYGSRYDSYPEVRISFTTIEQQNAVQVLGRAEMVTNPGSAYEKATDVTTANSYEIQDMLEQLDRSFGNRSTSAKPLNADKISRGTNKLSD